MKRAFQGMDRASLKMVLLSYPLLLVVDALALQAVLPGHRVVQLVHAVLAAGAFVWLLRLYRSRAGTAP